MEKIVKYHSKFPWYVAYRKFQVFELYSWMSSKLLTFVIADVGFPFFCWDLKWWRLSINLVSKLIYHYINLLSKKNKVKDKLIVQQ